MTNVQDQGAGRPSAGNGIGIAALDGVWPWTQAVLRIGASLLFMEHGAMKLFGWFGAQEPMPLFSLMGLAGVLETFGGLLILLGLLTRPVALVLLVEMIVAYFMVHFRQGWIPLQNKGELALLYALVFLFLLGNGAGPASLDRLIGRSAGR